MPDQDGYPVADELRRIETWDDFSYEGAHRLMDHVKAIWWAADWGWRRRGNTYRVSTGGWSGNEEILSCLQKTLFWDLYWESTRRGGHYVFVVN